jgi:hypothetical protein
MHIAVSLLLLHVSISWLGVSTIAVSVPLCYGDWCSANTVHLGPPASNFIVVTGCCM